MSGGASPVVMRRRPEAALAYHVLAHLPLSRDAASLHDDTLPSRPWVEGLHRAYVDAPGRLMIQAVGLWWPEGLDRLGEAVPRGLRDDAGRRLVERFLEAVAIERPGFMEVWAASEAEAETRRAEVEGEVAATLAELRSALWEQQAPPPPLVVLDCPALGLAGRGTGNDHERTVAVSLAAPVEHVLCQVLHEEVHAITDPVVRAQAGAAAQDTRAGQPGHAVHQMLEHAAIEVGRAVIEARAPRWAQAYARWQARFQ